MGKREDKNPIKVRMLSEMQHIAFLMSKVFGCSFDDPYCTQMKKRGNEGGKKERKKRIQEGKKE